MIAALCSADGRAEVHAFLVVLDWVNQRWSWRQTELISRRICASD
jgi:hypothetical protein